MVIKTASPGVIINEVDLTRGTSDAITTNVGGMVGPFQKGPVDELVLIETEAELQDVFGDPTTENAEYWWTISNFLEYGGVCYVIRCDDLSGGSQLMKNACDTGTAPYVKNKTDFEENYFLSSGSTSHFIARTPGVWGNAIGVSVIDAGADFIYRLSPTGKLNLADGQPAADSTAYSSAITPGTEVSVYNQIRANAFVAPTAWASVQLRATSNVAALSGEVSMDGVTTSTSRVLLTAQTDPSENGIYVTSASAWARADDANLSSEFEFAKPVSVTAGTAGADDTWYYTGADNPTLGTTALTFLLNSPAVAAPVVGDIVKLGLPTGDPASVPTGVISAINTETNVFTILVTAGESFSTYTDIGVSTLINGAGAELTAPITAAEPYFKTELYESYSAADANRLNVSTFLMHIQLHKVLRTSTGLQSQPQVWLLSLLLKPAMFTAM